MARTALVVKQRRAQEAFLKALAAGRKPRYPTRVYHRCNICGRSHGYMKRFDMCRICFRELAGRGLIMGVKKSSW